jgi:hypothetical protein
MRHPLLLALILLACEGPLPPETPKTTVDERAEVIPVIDAQAQPSATATVAVPPPALVFAGVGLKTPESVLYDAEADRYLVSNIQGAPDGKDNQGFISRLSPDGRVDELHWIAAGKNGVTLNAPKGSALVDGKLWVTDIDEVRRFDMATGKLEKSVVIAGATFLNDVAAAADGTVFVTDSGVKVGKDGFEPTGTDAVYEIKQDKVRTIAKGTELGRPNGVVLLGKHLLFATMGGNQLHELDLAGKVLRSAPTPKGGLDGLVRLADDDFLVSSWDGSAVYRGGFSTTLSAVLVGERSPADIGFDSKRNRILIPVFLHDEVRVVDLPAATTSVAPRDNASQK